MHTRINTLFIPHYSFPGQLAKALLPRLAILLILNGHYGALAAMLGVVCGTWSVVNRSTSMRDILVPLGQTCFLSVRRGNKMVGRTELWFDEQTHVTVLNLEKLIVWPTASQDSLTGGFIGLF